MVGTSANHRTRHHPSDPVHPAAARTRAQSASEPDANSLAIDHVTITDGSIVSFNLRDHVEHRLEGINADVAVGGDRKIKMTGSARGSEHPLKFEIKATAPTPPLQRQNIPVELTLDAADLLQGSL